MTRKKDRRRTIQGAVGNRGIVYVPVQSYGDLETRRRAIRHASISQREMRAREFDRRFQESTRLSADRQRVRNGIRAWEIRNAPRIDEVLVKAHARKVPKIRIRKRKIDTAYLYPSKEL